MGGGVGVEGGGGGSESDSTFVLARFSREENAL